MNQNQLADHLFRHESGKIVASLTRIFGSAQLYLAEDIVQETMLAAMEQWRFQQPPNPSAWLYAVAKNKAVDYLRREQNFRKIAGNIPSGFDAQTQLMQAVERVFLPHEIEDNQLRMMFTVCHPEISTEAQIAMMLKTLSGFSVPEIARAFLTNEANINKRLFRAREKIRTLTLALEVPSGPELPPRLNAVLKGIYLIFNEGYNSTSGDEIVRYDLCSEAMRLCQLLCENQFTARPECHALLALMCFHASRFDARSDSDGGIILMKDQNRALWDTSLIVAGMEFLDIALKENPAPTEYHLQALIASVYSLSERYEKIDWRQLLLLYDQLVRLNPSPAVWLNRAIVLSKLGEKQTALDEVLKIEDLGGNYLYHAVLGDLFKDLGQFEKSRFHILQAKKLTQARAEKALLDKWLGELPGTMIEKT